MAVIPHPPYSPDLAPCDFFLFPKMKLKLQGRRFDITEEIQAESQRVIDTLTEKYFQEEFQNGGDDGSGVYMRKGTTSMMMAADRHSGEVYGFYSVSAEYFAYTLVSYTTTPTLGLHYLLLFGFNKHLTTTNGPSQISTTEVFHLLGYYLAYVETYNRRFGTTHRSHLQLISAKKVRSINCWYMTCNMLCVSIEGQDRSQGRSSPPYTGQHVSFPGVTRLGRGVHHPSDLAPRLKKE
jgi:hypothetical protein